MKNTVNKATVLLIIITLISVISLSGCGCSSTNTEQATTQPTTENIATTAETTEPVTTEAVTTEPQALPTEDEDKIESILNNLTLEEKIGQMFYVRCPESGAIEKVSQYHLGGYILFREDFDGKTKEEVIADIESYQNNAEIPLLIGTDEEGGTVVRVSSNPNLRSTPFLSPSDTFANGGWQAISDDAQEKADLLLSLGINVNMAPVCDLTSEPDAFMYYRSFSDNLDYECEYVKTVVGISKQNQLGTVLKHFPGYGNNEDTHTGIAYDSQDYSEFESRDFVPFEVGIDSGADCVLVSHNIVECMDSQYPASLSENVHRILREDLSFDGVIMTDDLYMDAIRNYTGESEAAVMAVKAGNDILCCTDFEVQYPAVLEAVEKGEIPVSQIDDSVRRILKWKQDLGLI